MQPHSGHVELQMAAQMRGVRMTAVVLPPWPKGRYDLILLDAPWCCGNRGPNWKNVPAYDTLSAEQVAEIPILNLLADNVAVLL